MDNCLYLYHMKIQKTNAARLLDREKIAYTLVPYQVDEEHLDAMHVASVQDAGAERRQDRTLRVRHSWRQGSGPEDGGQGIGKQELQSHTHEGTAADDRIYQRRMFSDRDEETVSNIYSRVLSWT